MVRLSFLILLSTFLFAVMAVLMKFATVSLTVWEILLFRSLFGIVFCGTILRRRHLTPLTSHPWKYLLRCILGTGGFTLGVFALKYLPLGTAQAFRNASPLWFCLFLSIAAALQGERLEHKLLLAVAAGFAGVLLILRPDIPTEATTGALIGVLAGLTSGAADYMIRNLSQEKEPPERIVFYFMLSGTLTGLAVCLVNGFSDYTWESVLLLLGIGLMGTLGQLIFTSGWTRGHPLLNAVFQFTGIPFAVLFGFILFGERPDGIALLGITLVTLAGLSASIIRRRAELRTRETNAKA
ncbi:DMT family transporter [Sutterella sp.]|uniref:DMT family transporter n=1 Tax=Sutterella sp. TaxID=1981025 RepID=UPI0026DEF35C|nr:DMT family transporter [Sutterella sp.]MDO5532327.1 DMT family transporter [Sutterella sp.]